MLVLARYCSCSTLKNLRLPLPPANGRSLPSSCQRSTRRRPYTLCASAWLMVGDVCPLAMLAFVSARVTICSTSLSIASRSASRRRLSSYLLIVITSLVIVVRCLSDRRDSNPQPSAWEADALPLRHYRLNCPRSMLPCGSPRRLVSYNVCAEVGTRTPLMWPFSQMFYTRSGLSY